VKVRNFTGKFLFFIAVILLPTSYSLADIISAVNPSEQQGTLRVKKSDFNPIANSFINYRCQSIDSSGDFTFSITNNKTGEHITHAAICDLRDYSYNYEHAYLDADVSVTLIMKNSSADSRSVTFSAKHVSESWENGQSTTITAPAAKVCSVSLPNNIDLGNFTADQIKKGVDVDHKITVIAAGNSKFTLTFSGPHLLNDFLLGDDVYMRLSYNYGADLIASGVPFTVEQRQVIDIRLYGAAPTTGTKTTAITVTLNLL